MTLCAAIGAAALEIKIQNETLKWGAIGGLTPDMNIIPAYFMDGVSRFTFHCGLTHSLLFSLMLADVPGDFLSKKNNLKFNMLVNLQDVR